ncbi:Glycosyltransferase involved in cell wall bisynthesis [Salegentibacter echinorum]|uniref:Glycosyltransferase involved in cell wall bisynthesis n=1 Tax=Salegentibacter echinorum TaxID=1073325 RepID=A0A1M5CIL7_SALEC|nr:GT4 family glycosyltransferase PelF [Salegentibacter echinorum]SHF54549.1 Glycosyltransferase involved in cell wall bisynthesis [Salegentibacter echinorum]
MSRTSVLLILEGTYPFNGGGVSTWAHTLCNKVEDVDFKLYSINASFETESRYKLSDNISELIQVPLWTPDEPQDYVSYGDEYYKTVAKKEWTTDKVVKENFIPLFKELLEIIYSEEQDVVKLDELFYKLWLYFDDYDYKETIRNKEVWLTYRDTISKLIVGERNPDAFLIDLTIGLRWIYRFLIPLSLVDIPKVDVAHLTLSGFPVIPALIANYKYGTKIMLTEHGVFIRERLLAINNSEYPFFLKDLLIRFSEAIARLVYYKSEVIISVNKFNQKWEKWYGADPEKFKIIYNGIDPEIFKPGSKPKHLEGIPTVVALARIFELKDILTMIRSCAVVKSSLPNIQYLVYGDKDADPEYTQTCQDLIEKMNLQDNFKLMGPRSNPQEIFLEGDISILTSISEGFPYTVIESMSCGIPVVSTDVGGVKEALDEDCGFTCKPKDAEEIGKKVLRLLKDEQLRKEMARNSREKVLNNFTLDKFIGDYETVYKDISPGDFKKNKSKTAKTYLAYD